MKFEPKFYQNSEDDNHCLQASVMMVLNTLNGPVDWDEVNEMTRYEDGLYSWSSKAAVALAEYIEGIKLKSDFNFKEFAISGENYLEKAWDTEWLDKQREKASPGFKREQNFAKELIAKNLFEKGSVDKEEIEKLLSENLIIALVDFFKLVGKEGMAGHFVVLYGADENSFLLHDPGLPPRANWAVNKNYFMKAFRNDLIVVPKCCGK